jgi:hypothetical protein
VFDVFGARNLFGAFLEIKWTDDNSTICTRIHDTVGYTTNILLSEFRRCIASAFDDQKPHALLADALRINLPIRATAATKKTLLTLNPFQPKSVTKFIQQILSDLLISLPLLFSHSTRPIMSQPQRRATASWSAFSPDEVWAGSLGSSLALSRPPSPINRMITR